MKILLVNKFYHLAGGAERYARLWTRALEERGHAVIPFAMKHPLNPPTPYEKYFVGQRSFFDGRPGAKGIDKLRSALSSIYSPEAAEKLARLIRDARPDVAHVNSYCYQLTGSILPVMRRAGLPVIQTAHEYKHICANQRLYDMRVGRICEACDNGRWYSPVIRRCLHGSLAASAAACAESVLDRLMGLSRRNIDCIVAPSMFLKRKLRRFGLVRPPVEHVANFVYAEDYDPDGITEPYFLYAGRLVAHKGVLTLIEAVGRIPGARLLIAGDGPLRDAVERIAADSPAEVEVLGFRDDEQLRALLERCLAAVVPSEWHENYPFAVLEAMAAGRAVVASRAGGMPEQIEDGVSGLLFEPGNADDLVEKLARLWQHRDYAGELGRNARRFVESNCAPQRHYESMMGIFKRFR